MTFFLNQTGKSTAKAINIKAKILVNENILKSETFVKCSIVKPACTWIKEGAATPKNVPIKNIFKGTPTCGAAILANQLGGSGDKRSTII